MDKKIGGVRLKEIFMFLGMYVLLSFFYKVILMLNRRGIDNYQVDNDVWYNLPQWFDDGGLQYIIMLLVSSIVWFIIFKLFRHWKLWQRFLLHLVTLPSFVWISQQGYYRICDQLDMSYLMGSGQVWDIFIPSLIYLIQFSIFHAYEYYVVNQEKLRTEIELKNSALKSELSALKAQLNPHFLYNVFNTINASVPSEMEETREMIAGLSDLFRYQLKASQEDLVNLEDELEFVQQYLSLEQKRFENRLKVSFDVPKELYKEKIPPMILQPLVENSVKHGISPLIEGGHIFIKIQKQHSKLQFEIIDTGIGIKDKEGVFLKGVGLGNTQKRIQKMYHSTIHLRDNSPSGLIVTFDL